MIITKDSIIDHFKSGIKDKKTLKLVLNMKNFCLITEIIKELITLK